MAKPIQFSPVLYGSVARDFVAKAESPRKLSPEEKERAIKAYVSMIKILTKAELAAKRNSAYEYIIP